MIASSFERSYAARTPCQRRVGAAMVRWRLRGSGFVPWTSLIGQIRNKYLTTHRLRVTKGGLAQGVSPMTALTEFLGVRHAVALWESRTDAELGAVHGLGLSEFATLYHLAEAPGGRLRRIDLARRVALTASGVTRLLTPLEKRGIVAREQDGTDARAT